MSNSFNVHIVYMHIILFTILHKRLTNYSISHTCNNTYYQVNLCSGELQQNALHLAALINVDEIMVELLRHGGDIEIRDAKHYQPIALTTSYKIR